MSKANNFNSLNDNPTKQDTSHFSLQIVRSSPSDNFLYLFILLI